MSTDASSSEMKGLLDSKFVPKEQPQQHVTPAGQLSFPLNRLGMWFKRHWIFALTVLAPTLVSTLYYGFLASDVYISESRFLVRSPQQPMQTGLLGSLLQGTGFAHSEDDMYSVRDYILSRDALKELDSKLSIRKLYSNERVGYFERFPGLNRDRSFEAFYRYYLKHVGVDYDAATSISVLTVRAFGSKDAYRINSLLLDMSERLVNSLNDRSRSDLVRFAENEVRIATEKARDASLALLAYRSRQSVFEPDKQADIELEGVARLQGELVSTEAEIAQLKKLSPDNPQIAGLESRSDSLRTAIGSEAAKVTSAKGSLSARAPTFERLALESDFADKQLGAALAALETARSEAARQQLYLERLVQPNLPDKAMEPRRFRSVLTVFLVGMIAWGVMSLVVASVREHDD